MSMPRTISALLLLVVVALGACGGPSGPPEVPVPPPVIEDPAPEPIPDPEPEPDPLPPVLPYHSRLAYQVDGRVEFSIFLGHHCISNPEHARHMVRSYAGYGTTHFPLMVGGTWDRWHTPDMTAAQLEDCLQLIRDEGLRTTLVATPWWERPLTADGMAAYWFTRISPRTKELTDLVLAHGHEHSRWFTKGESQRTAVVANRVWPDHPKFVSFTPNAVGWSSDWDDLSSIPNGWGLMFQLNPVQVEHHELGLARLRQLRAWLPRHIHLSPYESTAIRSLRGDFGLWNHRTILFNHQAVMIPGIDSVGEGLP